nr:hypothetical protein [Tanacetum cinerariifolium]
MNEKPDTPRSCLRWKPTGRIFKTSGLSWIPTGKMFTDSTTMVDNEPLNGSNEDITNTYIQKISKEQVKEQVKVQVFKILRKIEKTVNEQLEAEVLTRSSNSSKTSYAMPADLSELELKKIG